MSDKTTPVRETTDRVWTCKVGFAGPLPSGSDGPMRDAIAAAYRQLTGREPEFVFSGWAGELTEGELACVENRMPDPEKVLAEHRKAIDDAVEGIDSAEAFRG